MLRILTLFLPLAMPMGAMAQQTASAVAVGSGERDGSLVAGFVTVSKEGVISYCEVRIGTGLAPECTVVQR